MKQFDKGRRKAKFFKGDAFSRGGIQTAKACFGSGFHPSGRARPLFSRGRKRPRRFPESVLYEIGGKTRTPRFRSPRFFIFFVFKGVRPLDNEKQVIIFRKDADGRTFPGLFPFSAAA
jgi:hypothetical protein